MNAFAHVKRSTSLDGRESFCPSRHAVTQRLASIEIIFLSEVAALYLGMISPMTSVASRISL